MNDRCAFCGFNGHTFTAHASELSDKERAVLSGATSVERHDTTCLPQGASLRSSCAHPPGQHDADLSDGFGCEWECCKNPGCDIQIVRPGRVQCNAECLFDPADYCDYCGWVEPDKHLATCNRPSPDEPKASGEPNTEEGTTSK